MSLVQADAIVMTRAMKASTIAEFFIEEDRVRVELEIGVNDLDSFRNLMPDELYVKLGHDPEPLKKRFPRFHRQDLVLTREDGIALGAWIEKIEGRRRIPRDEISGEPLPGGEDEGEPVISATLIYPFEKKPRGLAFTAPRDQNGRMAAEIGFVVYHRGVPVNDFRYLSARQALDLDWEDPWYSRFRVKTLRRQYDAPLSAFLYVEPYEVRAEVIARPVDLQKWVDLGLKDRLTIPVDMQEELKRRAAEFIEEHVNLVIDGELVNAELDRVNFLRRTLRTSTVINPPEELSIWSATLGLIYVVPTKGLPQEVSWEWNLFTPKMQYVMGAATDEAGPLRFVLQPQDNVLWWKNFLKNPTMPTFVDLEQPPVHLGGFLHAGWLGGLIGAAMLVNQFRRVRRDRRGFRRKPTVVALCLLAVMGVTLTFAYRSRVDDERAGAIVKALLHNVYRAFDFREESTIYDALDRSVTGDLLTQIYLETRRGLELQSQGGARAKVKQIDLLEIDARSIRGEPGFLARCKWNVSGSVGHWGHIHQRTNQYEAEFQVKSVDGQWKITDMEVLLEERI
ncbi:MAG: hypothetical protein V3U86_07145 [Acidobacteriota bacterium]